MNKPLLHIRADDSAELLSKLAAVDISVPLQTEGRSTEHREQYMVARLLATLAETQHLAFPLALEHRDKPDFALKIDSHTIGIECVESVHEEWAQIRAIRERDFPDALIFLPMLKPGKKNFSMAEKIEIARGDRAGPPWVGGMAERQWAQAHMYVIEQKTKKLRAGNYSNCTENWLLIQDEWPVPMYGCEERKGAAALCAAQIQQLLMPPAFTQIFVGDSSWLLRLVPGPVEIWPMRNLWSNVEG